MKRTGTLICFLLISYLLSAKFNTAHFSSTELLSTDETVIEITDETLINITYHQITFDAPTRIIYTNLKTVDELISFHECRNLIGVEFPALERIGGQFYFYGNVGLKTISAPELISLSRKLVIVKNNSLTDLDVCKVKEILVDFEVIPPFYYITDNNESVDGAPSCWGNSVPTELSLSNSNITENKEQGTQIGLFSASTGNPDDSLIFYMTQHPENDNEKFTISGNALLSVQSFNYEAKDEYRIVVGVRNIYGDFTEQEFTINILDLISEEYNIVEISDTTLNEVYYHKISYNNPTKLIFNNLTTVEGKVNFRENYNLVGVEFPLLERTSGHFAFHGNNDLQELHAPKLATVYEFLYIANNNSLIDLDVCNLTEILPLDDFDPDPYYYIQDNTELIDATQPCWGSTAPSNLSLSESSIRENSEPGTVIGVLSAINGNQNDSLSFYLSDVIETDNDKFSISGNELLSAQSFNYEVANEYSIEVWVRNQYGESTSQYFKISILDIVTEDIEVIEISDTALSAINYHRTNYVNPTKLVFTNLKKVEGMVYFYQNNNLTAVEFPNLVSVDGYFYCSGNLTLEYLSAPILNSVTDYLYVEGNLGLGEFNICSMKEIIQSDFDREPYYYIKNNPVLNHETTCLINTIIGFKEAEFLELDSTGYLRVGNFNSNFDDVYAITYFFVDNLGNEISDSVFCIIDNKLYLTKEYDSYRGQQIPFLVGAIRYEDVSLDQNANFKSTSGAGNGLNERITESFNVMISAVILGKKHPESSNSVHLYPNPVSSQIYMHGMALSAIEKVEIMDDSGRILLKINRPGRIIDISPFPPGIYFVRINTTKERYIKKIIKK